ncbi:MAG: tetratricopeptide repeat protein, partial [Syntrophothermus sp.]
MKKIAAFALLFIFLSNISIYCQQRTADSLIAALGQLSGENKVDALNRISDLYNNINCKVAIEYAEKAVDLAKAINYTKGLGGGFGCLGFSYINLDKQKAVYYTQKALEIRRKIQDKPGIGRSLNVLGLINYFMGDYVTSIDYHLQALKIREEIGDYNQIFSSYNNISIVYLMLEDYNTALAYLNKALDASLKAGRIPAIVYDNIGDIYSRT